MFEMPRASATHAETGIHRLLLIHRLGCHSCGVGFKNVGLVRETQEGISCFKSCLIVLYFRVRLEQGRRVWASGETGSFLIG